jgi:hypothetical protein
MALNQEQQYRQIRQVVIEYVILTLGDMIMEGVPRYDATRARWIVPLLCRTDRGILVAGAVELDEQARIVEAPTKAQVTQTVEAQLTRLPYLVYANREELLAHGFEPVTP